MNKVFIWPMLIALLFHCRFNEFAAGEPEQTLPTFYSNAKVGDVFIVQVEMRVGNTEDTWKEKRIVVKEDDHAFAVKIALEKKGEWRFEGDTETCYKTIPTPAIKNKTEVKLLDEGKESLVIANRKIEATWREYSTTTEWKEENRIVKIKTRIWLDREGIVIKQVSTRNDPESELVQTLIDRTREVEPTPPDSSQPSDSHAERPPTSNKAK